MVHLVPSALEKLISCLVSAPVMAYPDPYSPYLLHTDVSETGLGAALYQEQHGILQVIAYGSQTLTPAENNYQLHSGKLEFLAICEQFQDYLYYSPSFVIYTYNNLLTYVLSSAKLNTTGLRWIGELADFNFTIRYRPGLDANTLTTNTDADTLSRMPELIGEYMASCTQETCQDELCAIIQSAKEQDQGRGNWISSLTHNSNVLSESEAPPSINGEQRFDETDIRQAQLDNSIIGKVYSFVKGNKQPTPAQWARESDDTKLLLNEWHKLAIGKDGILRRKSGSCDQIVLPR